MSYNPQFLPTRDYIQVNLATSAVSVSDNGGNRCTFNNVIASGNGGLSLSSGKVELTANQKYQISAYVLTTTPEDISIYDFTNGVNISPKNDDGNAIDSVGSLICIVTPTGNIDVGVSADTTTTFEDVTATCQMLVEEL